MSETKTQTRIQHANDLMNEVNHGATKHLEFGQPDGDEFYRVIAEAWGLDGAELREGIHGAIDAQQAAVLEHLQGGLEAQRTQYLAGFLAGIAYERSE